MVTRTKKEEQVAQLKHLLSRAQLTIVSDYRGLTVKEMTELRRKLQAAGGEYAVAKNTLVKIALADDPVLAKVESIFKGPTALVIGIDDPVGPTKALMEYLKETKKELEIRGGIFEGRKIGTKDIEKIATLPGRDEMVAKLMGSMQAPAKGVVMALSGVARNLVYVLEAVRQQKEQKG